MTHWQLSKQSEFSFFLAIPIIIAASLYDLIMNFHVLDKDDFVVFLVGFVISGFNFFFRICCFEFTFKFHWLNNLSFFFLANLCFKKDMFWNYLITSKLHTSFSWHSSSPGWVTHPFPQILTGNLSHLVSPTKLPLPLLSMYLVVQADS